MKHRYRSSGRNTKPFSLSSPAALLIAAAALSGYAAVSRPPRPEFAAPAVPGEEIWREPDPAILPYAYPASWYGDRRVACSLTFDDGTLDHFLVAAPELDARGIRGTFFIITGVRDGGVWLDGSTSRRVFGWDEARELAWRGHEVASHSAGHLDLMRKPEMAEAEIDRAYNDIGREIPWISRFSFGWPYWRSSPRAVETALKYHEAARAGGVNTRLGFGGVSGKTPEDFMGIGAWGVLASDGEDVLKEVLETVYRSGGWLIPNFHGINDGKIDPSALGWNALSIDVFRKILDILGRHDFWFVPFGEAARYVRQRDFLSLQIRLTGRTVEIRYVSGLDPEVYNQNLTLVVELAEKTAIALVVLEESGVPLLFTRRTAFGSNRYLVDVPPGDGSLRIELKM